MLDRDSAYYPFPRDLPRTLFLMLIAACLLLGLSPLRFGSVSQVWPLIAEQWLIMLILIPASCALIASPFKYRDPSLDLKKTYYLGMFVALLYTLAKLRYLR